MKIKITPLLKVHQNKNEFYIGKIKLKDLVKSATVFVRERAYDEKKYDAYEKLSEIIENEPLAKEEAALGTQRRTYTNKLQSIADYIENKNGILPNSLIVSIDPIINGKDSNPEEAEFEDIVLEELIEIDEEKGILEFDPEKVQIKIIDGQHRFYGLNYIKNKHLLNEIMDNFECILTIFINLPYSEQADLFATINSTQKPVNKSILTDLKSLNIKKYKKIHVCNAIAKWFNEKEDKKRGLGSWKDKIKMLGTGKGLISQGMFVETISRLISNDKENREGVIHDFYIRKEYENIYFLLRDYFSAYESVFNSEWGNGEHILCKTVGFVAMIKIFEILYMDFKGKKEKSFYDFTSQKLQEFKESSVYTNNFFKKEFGSSLGEANKIRDRIVEELYSQEEVASLKTDLRKSKHKIRFS